MKKVRKDLIKRLHDGAWSGIKKEIEKEFPKLFKEDALVVGKWYKYPEFENWKLLITDSTKGKEKGVGFNCSGIWMKDWLTTGGNELHRLIPCSDKEVKEVLDKEAVKRGYKEGVRFTCLYNKFINNNCFPMLCSEGYLWIKGGCVFKDGKWATIIGTITKEQAEKELGKTILN